MEVEKIIRETFMPHIFFENMKTLSPNVGALSTMPVKKYVLGILNPVTLSQKKYLSSQQGSAELVRAVRRRGTFSNTYHLQTLGEERRHVKKYRDTSYETKLEGLYRNLKGTKNRLIIHAKSTGVWLIVCGGTVSGTIFSAVEFWDFLCTRYKISP